MTTTELLQEYIVALHMRGDAYEAYKRQESIMHVCDDHMQMIRDKLDKSVTEKTTLRALGHRVELQPGPFGVLVGLFKEESV